MMKHQVSSVKSHIEALHFSYALLFSQIKEDLNILTIVSIIVVLEPFG